MKRSTEIRKLMTEQQVRCCRVPKIEITQSKAVSNVRVGTFRCNTCRCMGQYCMRNGRAEIQFTGQETIPQGLWMAIHYLRRDIREGSMRVVSGWIRGE